MTANPADAVREALARLLLTTYRDDAETISAHIAALTARSENLEAAIRNERRAWLEANGPGGWIDDLRQRATAADETKLTAINGLARIAKAAIDQAIKDQP